MQGLDPVANGQLTREEIERAQKDPNYRLKLAEPKVVVPKVATKKGPRYTPVSRRQDRPNAILWLLRNHPELKDSQIIRLVGTTKPTITAIRERTHWNAANLQPQDPVALGLCSQTDLDNEVKKAARRVERERKKAEKEMAKAGTLLPAEETTAEPVPDDVAPPSEPEPEDGRMARLEDVAPELARAAKQAMATPATPEAAPDPDAIFASLDAEKGDGGAAAADSAESNETARRESASENADEGGRDSEAAPESAGEGESAGKG